MSRTAKISVVLPVRDGANRIVQRIDQVLAVLRELTSEVTEIVVVDDGSTDATQEVLKEKADCHPQLRIARHGRPRGMEAAGQTGLERATGELVFIQEADTSIRVDDLKRLYKMSEDVTVVAARAESTPRPVSDALVRRLRAWGTTADEQFEPQGPPIEKSSLQMIRRPHLQRLASPGGDRYRLSAETTFSTSFETVS